MRAEIVHIPDCPNSAEVGVRVRATLEQTGHPGAEIGFRLVTSGDEVAAVPGVEELIAAIRQRRETDT